MMKEDRAAAIGFQVKISNADILSGGEEELHAAIATYRAMSSLSHRTNILVLDTEENVDILIVVKQLCLNFGEMLRPFAYMLS